VALAKTLVEYPEVKRLLTFSHQVKTNKLAEMNWPWICKKVLGNSNIEKSVKKLFWQVLNDDAYNSASTKDHTTAIKRAKAHSRYAIGSCKVFGRGYDDKFSPKHHAAIHFDNKTIVTAVQEIWRVTRTDIDLKTNKPVCGDPNAYYILPMRFNDLGDKSTFSEDRLEQLLGILQFNKNIFDEFQSLVQNPNGSKQKQVRSPNGKIWIPEDFDLATFGGLITWIAQSSKGQMIDNIVVEAHTWLLKKYLVLPEINNWLTSPINQEFLEQEQFQSIFNYYKLFKTSPRTFREKFWAGDYVLKGNTNNFSQETKDQITQNLIEFKLFKDQCQKHKLELIEVMKAIAEKEIPKQMAPDNNYNCIGTKLAKEFGLPKHQIQQHVTGPLTKKWYANKLHWKNNHRIVYNLLAVNAADSCGLNEWAEKVIPLLEQHGISTHNVAAHTLRNRFIRKDYYNALSKEEFEIISNLAKEVSKLAYKSRPYDYDPWNKNLEKTDPKKYKEWVKKTKAGQDRYYKEKA
jgi:hypothetical protein